MLNSWAIQTLRSYHGSHTAGYTQEAARQVWDVLLGMIVKGGPFTHSDKEKKLPELLDEACRIFPLAPPMKVAVFWGNLEDAR